MKTRIIVLGLAAALIVAVGPVSAGAEKKKETVRATESGRLVTATPKKVVMFIYRKKDLQEGLNLDITDETQFIGLKEGEKITDLRQGSELKAVYTHEKGIPLYGTAISIEVVKRR